MGWMQNLCQTYDNMLGSDAFTDGDHPLVPAGFIEKKAAIHVTLTAAGGFAHAVRFEKGEETQVVPSSPEAEGRTIKPFPYPLCEQLRYVAGDICEGENLFYDLYIEELSDWCAQADAPPKLALLRDYLTQKRLMRDMVASGFSVDAEKDQKGIVCFSVQSYETEETALWRRADVQESWLRRLSERMGGAALCYVAGEPLPALENHPKLQGNAKLISAKDDKTVFQYRGRFEDPAQAVSVSFDASIKAHNALIWLLKRQGFDRYGMKVVAWSTGGREVPSPVEDDDFGYLDEEAVRRADTFEAYGRVIAEATDGLARGLGDWKKERTDRVVILGLEAATTGRMSINYYQEMPGGEYAQRLERWFRGCMWEARRIEGPKENRRMATHFFTPSPLEIATAVLGKSATDIARGDMRGDKAATKLMRQLRLRLLRCVVDASPLPHDIVLSAVRRASAPRGFTNKDGRWLEYEWRLSLSVACALFRMQQVGQGKEGYDVGLNEKCSDRDYLYGRLLALCDMVEYSAMDRDALRQTNAIRYMQMFQQRPFEMWPRLQILVRPYMSKLSDKGGFYRKLIGQVEMLFSEEDRKSEQPLGGFYLHGYYCQRQALFTKKEEAKGAENT